MNIQEINVNDLNLKYTNNENFILLDVRTDQEVFISKIKGSIHIPMNDVPTRLDEINKEKEIIVQCKSGKRSAKVCEFLLNNNYSNVKNLKGGIIAWSEEIDSSIIVY